MSTYVIATGGFDPIHIGHIEYLKAAKKLGDRLIVGVNSDDWLTRKKGRPFMDMANRLAIVESLEFVDRAISLDHKDTDGTCKTLLRVILGEVGAEDRVIFANGGDRTADNIPEMTVKDTRLSFEFSVGGDSKLNSSSWLINREEQTERDWGHWSVLKDYAPHTKVKELVVQPHEKLSMQKHYLRNELWFVAEGSGLLVRKEAPSMPLVKNQMVVIPSGDWHQLTNHSDKPLRIVEIQWGENCVEEDIVRDG